MAVAIEKRSDGWGWLVDLWKRCLSIRSSTGSG